MAGGSERERMLGALAKLRTEIGPGSGVTGADPIVPRPLPCSLLEGERETLVEELGQALAGLAAAAQAARPDAPEAGANVRMGSVGGAEWVMRWALTDGGPRHLFEVLPDLVYLVTLPFMERAGSRAAAARCRELIAEVHPEDLHGDV